MYNVFISIRLRDFENPVELLQLAVPRICERMNLDIENQDSDELSIKMFSNTTSVYAVSDKNMNIINITINSTDCKIHSLAYEYICIEIFTQTNLPYLRLFQNECYKYIRKQSYNKPFYGSIEEYRYTNDRKLFGETIRNLGRILALEACKHLDYSSVHINTPFGATDMQAINSNPVLFAIVRAGIKLQEGVSDILPESQLGFCTCPKNNTGGRDVQLFAPCEATGKTIIISDPIMTTASSMTHTIDAIVKMASQRKS